MITWLLTANNDHDLLDAGSADTRRVATEATEDAVTAALSHFATHATTGARATPVTVVVGDDDIICGPGYTDAGDCDAAHTTKACTTSATASAAISPGGADAACHAGRVLDREDGEKTGSTIRSVVAATALE